MWGFVHPHHAHLARSLRLDLPEPLRHGCLGARERVLGLGLDLGAGLEVHRGVLAQPALDLGDVGGPEYLLAEHGEIAPEGGDGVEPHLVDRFRIQIERRVHADHLSIAVHASGERSESRFLGRTRRGEDLAPGACRGSYGPGRSERLDGILKPRREASRSAGSHPACVASTGFGKARL
jgi:hypothetical protein